MSDVTTELAMEANDKAVQIARLKDENDNLRELVKRMFGRVNYECRCCSIFCSDWDEENECCVFTTLMRELGVD